MAKLCNILPADLSTAAIKHREDLLIMPMVAAEATLKHMTARPGVAGKEVVGELSGTIELGPYNATRVDSDGVTITGRTLETYLGSVVKRFDVNDAAKSVWGSLIAQGEELTAANVARSVLEFLSAKLGQSINLSIWSAKVAKNGTKTSELFNGFDTITTTEITAKTISAGNGNYVQLTEDIDDTNAADMLLDIYNSASDELQEQQTKLFLSRDIYHKYCAAYLKKFGSVPYNAQYKQTFLEGSDGLCEIVPLTSKKGSQYIHLTTKGNMLYGYGAGLADENITVEKYHEFLLSYVATMYFGVEFESISPERLFVAQLKTQA